MSPFLIFAIVLTVAYVIYYSVMITRDLYGKKDEVKTNEEVFDVSELEEEAVTVTESENGFSVADKQYETLKHEDDIIPVQQKEELPEYDIKEPEQKSVAENLEEQMQEKMEDTDMFMENQIMQDDLTACLLNGGDMGIGKPKVLATLINNEI
jgi:Lhr-like helicase